MNGGRTVKKDNLFAVASVRARENSLLTKSDLEQLINAESYGKAITLLSEKGYDINEQSDYSAVLDKELNKVWEFLLDCAPEAEGLNALIVKNDFQNLKAVLKAEVMGYNAGEYLVNPCIVEHSKLIEAISSRNIKSLPDFLVAATEKAIDVLSKTESAQLCDAVTDTAALETIISFAKKSGDELLIQYANEYCLACDIKTAFRAIRTGKSSVFLNAAIADNALIDKKAFIDAALSGAEGFNEYLSSDFSDYKVALEKSASSFEKYCDDKITQIIKKAKMTVFGISPLAAYYVAKETEIKCIRIILSAKQSHISSDIIRERMREMYV